MTMFQIHCDLQAIVEHSPTSCVSIPVSRILATSAWYFSIPYFHSFSLHACTSSFSWIPILSFFPCTSASALASPSIFALRTQEFLWRWHMTETDGCSEQGIEPQFSASLLRALDIVSLLGPSLTFLMKCLDHYLESSSLETTLSVFTSSFFVTILFSHTASRSLNGTERQILSLCSLKSFFALILMLPFHFLVK